MTFSRLPLHFDKEKKARNSTVGSIEFCADGKITSTVKFSVCQQRKQKCSSPGELVSVVDYREILSFSQAVKCLAIVISAQQISRHCH